eukprot:SAG22_NODE_2297_length_2744_cov_4.528544_3_plen_56_part_01
MTELVCLLCLPQTRAATCFHGRRILRDARTLALELMYYARHRGSCRLLRAGPPPPP